MKLIIMILVLHLLKLLYSLNHFLFCLSMFLFYFL